MFVKQDTPKSCSPVIGCTVVVVLALLTSACSSQEEEINVSQVVAQVNGAEITVHQLNAELVRLNVPATTDSQLADSISLSVLRNLVNQQLLVAEAKENDMERDPDVVQAVEQSKRQILAQAYARQLVGVIQKPDDKTATDYYDKHPELFKNRKIYTMRMLALAKQSLKPEMIEVLGKFATLAEAEEYLKQQNVAYQQKTVTSPAEDLPIGAVAMMVNAPEGQLFMQNMPTQVSVYDVVTAIDQPVTLAQSLPLINRFLTSQANEQRILNEIERLRKLAKIKYMGKYSGLKPETTAATAVTLNSANDDGENTDNTTSLPNLERGLSGLK